VSARANAAPHSLEAAKHRNFLTRAVIAATIGASIEWYDFFLYSAVTGEVFVKLFFPNSDPHTGALKLFAIWGVGFLSRPIGAAIFGHLGDRIGRKSTLIATLLLMGLATFLVALAPTYDSVGIWGAVFLTALRFAQGVGVGGEWAGAVLLSMEWARSNENRGLLAAWPQFGVPCGLLLSNIAFLFFSWLAGDQFLTWGWRAPFVLSLVLVAVGLWIRLGVYETPVFAKLMAEDRAERAPISEVIRQRWREILLSAFARMAEQAPFYIFTAFVITYATGPLKIDRSFVFASITIAACVSLVSIPLFGAISDRIGRKRMYMIGAIATGAYGFVYFALLDAGSYALVLLAIVLSLIPHDMLYGPQAALIAENFPPRLRYSGASLGYQLASIIAGGPAPLIATFLYGRFASSTAIAIFILACAIVTLIATAMMKDYTGADIDGEAR
jgi:MFS family permease